MEEAEKGEKMSEFERAANRLKGFADMVDEGGIVGLSVDRFKHYYNLMRRATRLESDAVIHAEKMDRIDRLLKQITNDLSSDKYTFNGQTFENGDSEGCRIWGAVIQIRNELGLK